MEEGVTIGLADLNKDNLLLFPFLRLPLLLEGTVVRDDFDL